MSEPFTLENNQRGSISITPIGGCGEFGMNMTAIKSDDFLYFVDCGAQFADPYWSGVDAVIPNIFEHIKNAGGVDGYIITHAHEDHIGGLPYFLQHAKAPVFCTPWSAEVLKRKLARLGLDASNYEINIVESYKKTKTSKLCFEYIPVDHSIVEAHSVIVDACGKRLFFSGDFKIDPSSNTRPFKLDYLKTLAEQKRVDLAFLDSTNAHKAGPSPTEKHVVEALINEIKSSQGRVFVTTFSSNYFRIKSIFEAAKATGRSVWLSGTGLETTLDIAKALNLSLEGSRVDENNAESLADEKFLGIVTGCQGEWRSALHRLAFGEHKATSVRAGDKFLFSSRVIPGNEKTILQIQDRLLRAGASVVNSSPKKPIHVSGHAYGDDIKAFLTALKPRHFVPIHGSFFHLSQNVLNGEALKIETHIITNGEVLELSDSGLTIRTGEQAPRILIDDYSKKLLGKSAIKKRLEIGEKGLVHIKGVFQMATGKWISPLEVDLIGLPSTSVNKGSEPLGEQIANAVLAKISRELKLGIYSSDYLFGELRKHSRDVVFKVFNKKPPVIYSVFIL